MNDQKSSGNPYSAPLPGQTYHQGPVPGSGGGGYVRQVTPLCICMIVQGALELLMGGFYVAMGFVVPAIIMNQPGGPGGGPNPMSAEEQQMVQMMFGLFYGVGGGGALIAGILRVVAGIRGLYFRGRILGIVANFAGLISAGTCYCLPTSLALCIWGSLVYFNAGVKHAFELSAEGRSPSEIEAALASGQFKV